MLCAAAGLAALVADGARAADSIEAKPDSEPAAALLITATTKPMVPANGSTRISPAASVALPPAPPSQPASGSGLAMASASRKGVTARTLGWGARIAPGCGPGVLTANGSRGMSDCPFSDFSTGVGVALNHDGIESRILAARSTRSPWSPGSLVSGDSRGWTDESSAVLTGITARFLDGAVRLESDFAHAENWQVPLAASPYEAPKRRSRDANAGRARIEFRPIARPGLQWSLAADYTTVGGWFPLEQGMLLESQFFLPGSSLGLSSKLAVGDVSVKLSHSAYDSDFGRSLSQRLTLSGNGLTLYFAARNFSTQPTSWLGLSEARQSSFSIGFDLDTAMADKGLLARLGRSQLFPRSASLLLRDGRDRSLGLDYDRRVRDVTATWETRLGETTLGYSFDRRIGRAGNLNSRAIETFQIDHAVRRGGWKLSADAAFTNSRAAGSSGYEDSSVAFGGSLSYQRVDGPEFRIRLGRDSTTMRLNDRSYLSEDRGLQVGASLDLTRYLQRKLKRDDLRLRLEYRRSLLDSVELLPGLDAYSFDPLVRRRDSNVVQVTFGKRI